MSLKSYLWEKMGWIVGILIQLAVVIALGRLFRANSFYIGTIVFFELVILISYVCYNFYKKQKFYNDLLTKLNELDKKYLITEMIRQPGFLEGEILCEILYEAGKSMNEWVSGRERSVKEFTDYVEMWIHEIKLPISALSLMYYNEKADMQNCRRQVDKISHYVEQILYYVRADNPQEDFLMKKCSMKEMVHEVLLEQKETLIAEKFTIAQKDMDAFVVSDTKWVKFMLGQIIGNSIKYKKGGQGYLGFEVTETDDCVILSVEDHGIGVPAADISRVFDKSFTGSNGRQVAASTGMGLYICRKMCEKLGHEIWMESEEGSYTRVLIRFGKDRYYL